MCQDLKTFILDGRHGMRKKTTNLVMGSDLHLLFGDSLRSWDI